ncbi:M48 family metalloprotease [Pseudomonas sp. Pseusp97]|uniref:M48 family metalloprotease n=1 Tax=Pseudomonas sp. Pseusp97 TaxID=3243065 RepID=UPI0039A58D2A
MSGRIVWIVALVLVLGGCMHSSNSSGGAAGVRRVQGFGWWVDPDELKQSMSSAYVEQLRSASADGSLETGGADLNRSRAILERLIPGTRSFRADAADWPWEVNIIDRNTFEASSGPDGKLILYGGVIRGLDLNDDELAFVIGHLMATSLREHARERQANAAVVGLGMKIGALLAGGNDSGISLGMPSPSMDLVRKQTAEADLIGLELAARGGFNPQAVVSLLAKLEQRRSSSDLLVHWQYQGLSERLAELKPHVATVLPLYLQARGAIGK